MTVVYLQSQKLKIEQDRKINPKEAQDSLEDLKQSLEAYIAEHVLPEMWANELRKVLCA